MNIQGFKEYHIHDFQYSMISANCKRYIHYNIGHLKGIVFQYSQKKNPM